MSQSPATPAKPGASGSNLAPHSHPQGPIARVRQNATFDSSPMSSTDDSGLDSSPATPLRTAESHAVSALRTQLDMASLSDDRKGPSDSPSSFKHPVYGISRLGSSAEPKRPRPLSLHSDFEAVHSRFLRREGEAATSSPAKLFRMLDDDEFRDVLSDRRASGAKRGSDADVSSLSKKDGRDFVVGGNDDDPFTSQNRRVSDPPNHVRGYSDISSQTSSQTPTARLDEQEPSGEITPESSKKGPETTGDPSTPPFSPRGDRIGQMPSADNAQAIYPPEACVFVANLASGSSDEELTDAVTEVFGQFGTVYVKIRRDSRGMPYAFCQYTNKNDAANAIVVGKNKIVCGRKCRTEIAKVQRALYASKHDGSSVDECEVRSMLERYGMIEKIFAPSETEKEIFALPNGLWVRFAYFQDCRDAQSALRDHSEYRFDQHPEPRDMTVPNTRRTATTSAGPSPLRGYGSAPRNFDRHAVFVGNLPSDATQEQLAGIFGKYGVIMSIQVTSRPAPQGACSTVFAFIEFMTAASASAAIEGGNGKLMLNGHTVRVERKDPFHGSLKLGTSPTRSVLGNSSNPRFGSQHKPRYQSTSPGQAMPQRYTPQELLAARHRQLALVATQQPGSIQEHIVYDPRYGYGYWALAPVNPGTPASTQNGHGTHDPSSVVAWPSNAVCGSFQQPYYMTSQRHTGAAVPNQNSPTANGQHMTSPANRFQGPGQVQYATASAGGAAYGQYPTHFYPYGSGFYGTENQTNPEHVVGAERSISHH